MSRPTRKQSPVNIPAYLHQALQQLSAARTVSSGQKVTIRQLIEDALKEKYGIVEPDASEGAAMGVGSPAQAAIAAPPIALNESDDQKFSRIVHAAFAADDTLAGKARSAEELAGTAAGSFGQRIKLKDLAYHLRSTETPVGSLAELIADYEAGGATELSREVVANA